MRSSRPHAADGSRPPAPQGPQYPQQSYADDGRSAQRRVPFGPEVSWPSGYYDLEYRDGAYSYPDERSGAGQRAALPPGEHPYAAFGPLGYGDPGYQDPGYDGPAAQDAGYPRDPSGLAGSGGGGYADGPHRGARHPALDGFNYDEPQYADGDLPDPRYPDTRFGQLGYDPEGYDASEAELYARPDDSRLAYDDPRYSDGGRYAADPGRGRDQRRFDETRFDMPVYDPSADTYGGAPEATHEPAGYDSGPGSPDHGRVVRGYVSGSDYDTDPGRGRGPGGGRAYDNGPADRGPRPDGRSPQGFADTLAAPVGGVATGAYPTRDSGPATGVYPARDGALATGAYPARDGGGATGAYPARSDTAVYPARAGQATSVMAPPEPVRGPRQGSFSDTMLDSYPAEVLAEPAADETDGKRGRRRSGTKDRKQWIALGTVAVVAGGAIFGVLKIASPSHPSGPAHTVSVPDQAGVYQRKPDLENQMNVPQLRASVIKKSSGQATKVVDGGYEAGATGQGATPQLFVFVGGHLGNAPPDTSISTFTQEFPGAHKVSAGPLGGKAACVEVKAGSQGAVAYCVWFDNDSFGELVSPTMTPSTLANVMTSTRPDFEKVAPSNSGQ